MCRKEVPTLKKENFPAWKSLMMLYLGGLGDNAYLVITTEHVDPTGTPTTKQLKQKKEHNQTMLEIASTLIYVEFDDIKGCDSAKIMWDSLQNIYGGDKNVLRAKVKSLRGKFDEMRMQEGETIV